MARRRDYAAEYARRNAAAKRRGYKNYSEERKIRQRQRGRSWILLEGSPDVVRSEYARGRYPTEESARRAWNDFESMGLGAFSALTYWPAREPGYIIYVGPSR